VLSAQREGIYQELQKLANLFLASIRERTKPNSSGAPSRCEAREAPAAGDFTGDAHDEGEDEEDGEGPCHERDNYD
jgi:hypothetical protein